MLLLPVLIFFAVTFGLVGGYLWLAPTKTGQRLQALAGAREKSPWTETLVKIAGPFARLSTPTENWDQSPLRVKFFNAGIRNDDANLIYFGAKTLLPLVFAGLAFVALRNVEQSSLTLLFYVMLFAMVGCYLPNIILHFKVKSRQREIFENFQIGRAHV